jgi:hypothetical protein
MGTTKMPTPMRPKKANGERQNVFWIRKKVPAGYRALDDRFHESGISRGSGVHGTGELLVDSLFTID